MPTSCAFCGRAFGPAITRGPDDPTWPFEIRFCPDCQLGVTVPVPTEAQLQKLYTSGGYRSDQGRRFFPPLERAIQVARRMRLRRIERFEKPGRVLDIGCGRGLFLHLMREHGWAVAGTEFNPDTARHAAETYAIDVRSGPFESWGFEENSFDAVCINHVLEHVRDPAGLLSGTSRLLRADGLLVVAVPNLSSLQARAGREVWFHLDPPHHLYHFTEQGLRKLFRRSGLRSVGARHFDLEYNPYGWLQTLLNRSGIHKNFLYDVLRKSASTRGRGPGRVAWDVVATAALVPIYAPLSLLLSVVESYIGRAGGTVEMYGRNWGKM